MFFAIQQGLTDHEEQVICKALKSVTGLVQLGLLQKPALLEMAYELVPYVCHPVSIQFIDIVISNLLSG